jgi:hypothetical protein
MTPISEAAQQAGRFGRGWRSVAVALVAALGAALAAFATALFLLPAALVFPVTAAGLVLAAATFALIAWVSPPEVGTTRLLYWDVAGALTVLGLCAALFGEPEQAVALMQRDDI